MIDEILAWIETVLLFVELTILFYLYKHILALEKHERAIGLMIKELKENFNNAERKNLK